MQTLLKELAEGKYFWNKRKITKYVQENNTIN